MDDCLGQTVAEILIRLRAEVGKREYGDGGLGDGGRRRALTRRSGRKSRQVASSRNLNDQFVRGARGGLILPQFRSQARGIHAHHGADPRIELLMRSVELNPDGHLL